MQLTTSFAITVYFILAFALQMLFVILLTRDDRKQKKASEENLISTR